MNLQIHAVNTGSIVDLEPRVRADVAHALRGVKDRVTKVTVHLRDVNGSKGGSDKHVTVEAHLAGLPALAVTAEDSDMGLALTSAMTKLEQAAQHRVGRQA
jgi:ribosome-associated translation inhibitor RaiA